MKRTAMIVSWAALAGTILPAALFLGGGLDLAGVKVWMLASTIAWFVATPLWMERAGS